MGSNLKKSVREIHGVIKFQSGTSVSKYFQEQTYSGPCDLKPLYLTFPSILRLVIDDTTSYISNINAPPL